MQAFKKFFQERLLTLPQGHFIDEEHAWLWYESVKTNNLDLELELAKLSHFTPEEAAIAVREFKNERADYGTMKETIQKKFLQTETKALNIRQRRLEMVKDMMETMLMEQMGLSFDQKIKDQVNNYYDTRYPFFKANLRHCYKMKDGRVLFVEFEAPVETSDQPTFELACMLNYHAAAYRLATGEQQVELLVVQLDYIDASLAILPVVLDVNLQRDIFKAGGYFYREYLLTGLLPPFIFREQKRINVALTNETRQMVDAYLKIEAFYKSSYEHREAMKKALFSRPDALSDRRLASFKKATLDEERLEEFLQKHADIAQLAAFNKTEYDVRKLVDLCEKSQISAPIIQQDVNYISRGLGGETVKKYMPVYQDHIANMEL
jgi:hypothetical protein